MSRNQFKSSIPLAVAKETFIQTGLTLLTLQATCPENPNPGFMKQVETALHQFRLAGDSLIEAQLRFATRFQEVEKDWSRFSVSRLSTIKWLMLYGLGPISAEDLLNGIESEQCPSLCYSELSNDTQYNPTINAPTTLDSVKSE